MFHDIKSKAQVINKTITILLLFIYSFVIFQTAYKYLAFKINQEYIVQALCVEREKEVNTCQGGCYLSKEMDETQNEPTQSSIPTKIKVPELQLEFLVNNKSEPKQFIDAHIISDNTSLAALNMYYQPLLPPPKC